MKDISFVIFIKEKKIVAYDTNRNDFISIDGVKKALSYSSVEDISKFNAELKSNFGLQSYKEIPTAITVINCGSTDTSVNKISELIEEAEDTNIVKFNMEQFKTFFAVDPKEIEFNDEELKAKTAENESLQKQLDELKASNELLIKYKEEKEAEETKRLIEQKAELEIIKNSIYKIEMNEKNSSGSFYPPLQSGDNVKKGDLILGGRRVKFFNLLDNAKNVIAKRDGKIFYIKTEGAQVNDGDFFAVIVDESWTKKQAKDFFEKNKSKVE